jgi:DNA-binding MarR family transcriptional regulator
MNKNSRDQPPIEDLLNEVRLLWNRLVQLGEELHAREPVTLGMRAVLEYLLLNGPTTVPDIARSRQVTRQHIQQLVNPLVDRGLVTISANPSHRRSGLVQLSPAGEQVIRRMKEREERVFRAADFGMSDADLLRGADTLRAVRRALADQGDPGASTTSAAEY